MRRMFGVADWSSLPNQAAGRLAASLPEPPPNLKTGAFTNEKKSVLLAILFVSLALVAVAQTGIRWTGWDSVSSELERHSEHDQMARGLLDPGKSPPSGETKTFSFGPFKRISSLNGRTLTTTITNAGETGLLYECYQDPFKPGLHVAFLKAGQEVTQTSEYHDITRRDLEANHICRVSVAVN
jgi:hypothetical protein